MTADLLYQHVLEYPDEVAPRLVYADWLEERGDPRAAFIRMQCRLAELPEEFHEHQTLSLACQRLLAAHEGEWVEPLRRLVNTWDFRRGFVEAVELTAESFGNLEAVYRLAPVRHAAVLSARGRMGAVAGSPLLARLRGLDVGPIDPADVRRLAASPHARGLRFLQVGTTRGEDILALLESADVPITALAPYHFSTPPALPPGEALLRVQSDRAGYPPFVSLAVIPALLTSAALGRLRALRLVGIRIPGPPNSYVHELTGNPHLTNLRDLALDACNLDDFGAGLLAGAPALGGLLSVSLAENEVSGAGLARLLAAWPGLERLNLAVSRFGPAVAAALAASPGSRRLREVSFYATSLDDAAVRALVRSPSLQGLRHLDLRCYGDLTTDTFHALADPAVLPDLARLDLTTTALTPARRRVLYRRWRPRGLGVFVPA